MANLIYQNEGTHLHAVPATAAQAEDVAFEVQSLASAAGRQSAQLDLGAGARSSLFEWRAFVQFATTPVLDEVVLIYLKTSDGVHEDNDDGTTEGAVSAIDKLKNLRFIGAIKVDQATADIEMVASSGGTPIEIRARYVNVVFWNASADALTADVDENGFTLIPVPDEIQ